ncbi:RNA polymerase sigma factor [Actinomadura logoneensis]|uniref:RNA polymerase sigma factor n=1 Tax=Actinomadura logoneensis TaxID=2293572 RepID=A0A372JSA3_9ACTN|nr:RNA polymerase sigma factor [Actinomadura logoneensis]RFU42228.1 RNA polymerase sigma factor [Actinomadura logoneensis]
MTAPSGTVRAGRTDAADDTEDDAAVISGSLADPDRFAAIYDRHFADIYRYVAARLGRDTADDLAAETFVTAFRKRDGFDPARGGVRPWLFGIATNLVALHRRAERRRYDALARAHAASSLPDEDAPDERIAARVTAEGARPRLADALAALPEGDRDALLLVSVAGLGYDEVGQALGIPAGTVGSRLSRARRKLREALGGDDPTRLTDTEEDPRG